MVHSSAYNSSGNSRAEKKIQDVKNLMRKCQATGQDFSEAHSKWRCSTTVQCASPAQLFYKRHVRSGVLPEIYRAIDPVQDAGSRRKQEQQARFQRVSRHEAPLLKQDQEVCLQEKQTKKWDIRAFVCHRRPHGRSYILETDSGSCFLRNRRFIKPVQTQHTKGQAKTELDHSLGNATSQGHQTL